MSSDEAIQLTNNDASFFKAYAVQKGYWNDAYINIFASTSSLKDDNPLRDHKPPEMSRGYFARVNAIRSVVLQFLDTHRGQPCQIINLGAGYDTLYFNLADQNNLPSKYVEIDFPRVVSSKVRLIKSKKVLYEKLQNSITDSAFNETTTATSQSVFNSTDGNGLFKLPTPISASFANRSNDSQREINTNNFSLISVDLRKISELDKRLTECNVDRSVPTLFISECVLVYMSTEHSSALLRHLASSFNHCMFLKYEQCNLNDKFGEIMLHNMQQRSCKLLGVDACQSLDSQKKSFTDNGFIGDDLCQVFTMTDYYKNRMNRNERERIESIEFLDEAELLFQLMDHYCICIASNSHNLMQNFL